MVKHYNPSIIEDAARIFNSKQGDYISTEINPNIQPTVEVARNINIVRHVSNGATGSATIFTTPSDKDFYLTTALYSYQSDAACDATAGQIIATIDGVARRILGFAKLTLTARNGEVFLSFKPIKIDRNTTITVNTTFTVGTFIHLGIIQGYTVETTKGV